jgi:hypothetical protein
LSEKANWQNSGWLERGSVILVVTFGREIFCHREHRGHRDGSEEAVT